MRKRYRYDAESKRMVEIGFEQHERVAPDAMVRFDSHFKTTDGTEITSRRKRAEYMKRNNLVEFEPKSPESAWARKLAREREIIRDLKDAYEKRRDTARANNERFFGRK